MRNYSPSILLVLVVFVALTTIAVISWFRINPTPEPWVVWLGVPTTVFSIWAPKSYRFIGRWLNAIIFIFVLVWLVSALQGTGINSQSSKLEAFVSLLFSVIYLVLPSFIPSDLIEKRRMLRDSHDDKKRRALIEKAKEIWIEGVLMKDLKNGPIMSVSFKLREDLSMDKSRSYRPVTYTHIESALRLASGRLVIVGEQGSGKSFALLELTQNLLEQAEHDEHAPIPLIFPLGNWGQHRQPLVDWLVSEMENRSLYQQKRELAENWLIHGQQIILLLDGLDQVADDLRDNCVSAINVFCKDNPDTSMIICSRLVEYEALQLHPKLNRVIELTSLTPEQVLSYIHSAKLDGIGIQNQLESDPRLLELAQNRLMLSLMCDPRTDFMNIGLRKADTQDELRRKLLSSYIDSSFVHHEISVRYSQNFLRKGLSWLAWNMRAQQESPFFIERIQPHWLPGWFSQMIYRLMLIPVLSTGWTAYGFAAGLIELLIILWAIFTIHLPFLGAKICVNVDFCRYYLFIFAFIAPIMAAVFGLMGGASFAIPLALFSRRAIPFEDLGFSLPNSLRGLVLGTVVALLTITLTSTNWYSDTAYSLVEPVEHYVTATYGENSLMYDLYLFLLIVLYIGPVFVLTGSVIASAIYALTFMVRKLLPNFQELRRWMIVGGIIGMLSGFAGILILELKKVAPTPASELFVGTILGNMFISTVMTGFSIRLSPKSKSKNRRPNLGIRQSIIRSIVVMTIGLAVVIIILQLSMPWSLVAVKKGNELIGFDETYLYSLYFWRLAIFAFIPAAFGIIFGGLAVVQHLAIRVALAQAGYMPMRIRRFLDDACKIGMLQRVGSGYQFRHQLFLEHFADSFKPDITRS